MSLKKFSRKNAVLLHSCYLWINKISVSFLRMFFFLQDVDNIVIFGNEIFIIVFNDLIAEYKS